MDGASTTSCLMRETIAALEVKGEAKLTSAVSTDYSRRTSSTRDT